MTKLTKIVYFLLFVALVLQPHFTDHLWFVPKPYVESILTVIIVGIAVLVYYLHQRELLKSKKLQEALRISQEKLLDSFKYLGTVNRLLPLFQKLSSGLMTASKYSKRDKKNIFNNLLATAVVSIAKADWGLFRFIEIKSQRTIKEFVCANKNQVVLNRRVVNTELISSRGQQSKIKTVGEFSIIPTSDREMTVQCFLVFPQAKNSSNDELSTVQAIVDQAQLFYKYLFA